VSIIENPFDEKVGEQKSVRAVTSLARKQVEHVLKTTDPFGDNSVRSVFEKTAKHFKKQPLASLTKSRAGEIAEENK
jgi:hypothetical protein